MKMFIGLSQHLDAGAGADSRYHSALFSDDYYPQFDTYDLTYK
jgi:hypothetical protein